MDIVSKPEIITSLINLTIPALLLFGYLIIMFLITHIKRDISIGNFTWGGAVMILTLYSFFTNPMLARHILITTLIMIWGLRLTGLLYLRYKKGADPRYVTWQNQQGTWALLFAITWIFVLNGGFGTIMALPSFVVNTSTVPGINFLDIIGALVWLKGFVWESISDYQLFSFLKNPTNKGKVMDQGLWHYTRHPNYFGEITLWWGIYLIALSVDYGYLTIVAPLGITISLLFVTGIPMNEKPMENNPDYQEYKKRTNAFIPWFPKQ